MSMFPQISSLRFSLTTRGSWTNALATVLDEKPAAAACKFGFLVD